jgi:riboflavin kinase/FMN adenylyltransferase
MVVIQDAYAATDLPQGGVAAIGNFDAIHLGHRAILEQVTAQAARLGAPAVLITFDPHPAAILRPEMPTPVRLSTPEQKEKLLADLGVSVLLVVRFTAELAKTPAAQFVRDFLGTRLKLQAIYVGSGFRFGYGRQGDLALLSEMGRELGFSALGVPEVLYRGERISTSRIRQAVGEGKVEDAREMLGRPYAITGVIVRGDRMGQKLGWPTINLAAENKLVPADGVYASRVFLPGYPATFDSVTNIGTRPTVYENYQRVVESHILDFKADVYKQRVELSFYKRLREERIFQTVMDLSAQIRRDVEATREYFSRQRQEPGLPADP